MQDDFATHLNAVCPYYTMFPLAFPLGVLRSRAKSGDWVADPFCGRGTTNFAARLLGLPSVGVDSSPVAVALTKAKLAEARAADVVRVATGILEKMADDVDAPEGEFWRRAYHPSVLKKLCWLRLELLRKCEGDARVLLRAIILGALHGPRTKVAASHLSNQCPRTFAPKPDYAIRYWRRHRMKPPEVDVLEVIQTRARRYLGTRPALTSAAVVLGDSREGAVFSGHKFRWIITSPPYYGMRTYIADQWLRAWFLGGPAYVPYRPPDRELGHRSPEVFSDSLRKVWRGLAEKSRDDAQLVIRFGGIADRKADPVKIMKDSLAGSGWRLRARVCAGDANHGRRQASQFGNRRSEPLAESDYYAVLA